MNLKLTIIFLVISQIMSAQNTSEYYLYILIQAEYEDKSGFFTSYITESEGVDESRSKVREYLNDEGVINCYISEVDIITFENIDTIEYNIESIQGIKLSNKRFSYEKNPDEYLYVTPEGISLSINNSKEEYDSLVLSYSNLNDEYAKHTIEIIPDYFTIHPVTKLICENFIDELNFIGIYLTKKYDNRDEGNDAIWINNSEFFNPLEFLFTNNEVLFQNGFLSIELGNENNNNRIRINDSKEILFWSDNDEDVNQLVSELNKLGFEYKKENISIGNDLEYIKYRMKNSLNRKELIEFLRVNNFEEHPY